MPSKKDRLKDKLIVYGETFLDPELNKSENTKKYPVVITKLRGRGYAITDTARDIYSVCSGLKLKKAAVFIPGKNKWYKGRLNFDHLPDSGPTIYRQDGTPRLTERFGLLTLTYKKAGIKKSREIPLKTGDTLLLVIF